MLRHKRNSHADSFFTRTSTALPHRRQGTVYEMTNCISEPVGFGPASWPSRRQMKRGSDSGGGGRGGLVIV
jgi:hypothetical protein